MNLDELRRAAAATIEEADHICQAASTENRELTEDEGRRADELLAKAKSLRAQIARAEEMDGQRTWLSSSQTKPVSQNVTNVRELGADRPWGYDTFRMTEAEFVAQHPRSITVCGVQRDARTFYREAALGEFLQKTAVADSGGPRDPRLQTRAVSGASEGVPSEGGFLVHHDMSTMLLDRAIEAAQLAPLCTSIEIGANSDGVDLPYIDETSRANGSRWGGVQVYWRAEADTVTATKPKFGQLDFRLQELMGLAYATDRLLKDTSALAAIFATAFTSEMSFKLDDAIFRGDGAGLPLGIIDSNGPRVQQTKETGQVADTIVLQNLQKMWTRILPRSKSRGVWLINSETTPQLDSLTLNVGTAGVDPRVVSYDGTGAVRIKGRPVVECEQCSALGDEGDIVFADLSEYLLIRKGGVQAAESMHVRFIYGENTFRWIYRVNGRPALRSAITPFKTNTSNTQSTFVTLAARA